MAPDNPAGWGGWPWDHRKLNTGIRNCPPFVIAISFFPTWLIGPCMMCHASNSALKGALKDPPLPLAPLPPPPGNDVIGAGASPGDAMRQDS